MRFPSIFGFLKKPIWCWFARLVKGAFPALHHHLHPGREKETAQEVEVIFTAEDTCTRVELTHRNWTLLGERAVEMRESYVQGWDYVLGFYASQVETLERS